MRLFRKDVDVGSIYGRCMKDGAGFRLSATEVSAAFDSPFSLFCKHHADPAQEGSSGSVPAGSLGKGSGT